jgi:CheY-like chemotaxis protein
MTKAMRILLVDDDPAGAELTAAALGELGLGNSITIASDGEEALDFLFGRGPHTQEPKAPPAVVLLDLKMPKVDGHEVLRQIRADPKLRHTRVVVLTSSDQETDIQRVRELGSDAYLVKPTSIVELIDQLGQLSPSWHEAAPSSAPPPT